MTIEETVEALRVCRQTIWRYRDSGKLPKGRKIAGKTYLPAAAVHRLRKEMAPAIERAGEHEHASRKAVTS